MSKNRKKPSYDPAEKFSLDLRTVVFLDNLCQVCAHYTGSRRCLAYPAGIPEAIWTGEVFHFAEMPGDRGYRFKRSKTIRQDRENPSSQPPDTK